MNKHSLGAILTTDPACVTPATPLAEVLDLMRSDGTGCVLAVDGERRPLGIFTDQDALRMLAASVTAARLSMAEAMRQPVLTAPIDLDCHDAHRLMAESGVQHLALVDTTGRLAGLISWRDLVARQRVRIEALQAAQEQQRQEIARTHDQMRGLHQRLQNHGLMNQVSDAIFMVDTESGAFVDVNDQACRSLGYTREELLAMKIHELSTTATDPGAWQVFLANLRARGQLLFETGQRRRNGEILPVQVNVRLIEAEGREYAVSVARDLSHTRAQDAQLSLQIHALNAAANATVITDTGPSILWANAAFTHLTGYSLAEAIGRKPAELVNSGKQTQPYYQHMWETILAGQVWHGELINKHKDGSLYDEELTITPVRAEGREITHFIAIKQDISARKASEAALRESEESYRGLFDSIDEAIYILDENGRFLDVNQGVERMYGYTRAELVGQTPAFLFAPGMNDLDAIAEQMRRARAGEAQQREVWGRRKNGEVFPKEAWINKGRYFGRDVIIAVARDITRHKALEAGLRRLAATDALTGLANRRHFLEQMSLALARHQRYETPTALLMLDLDWFKNINDAFGHATGNEVLKHVARMMTASLRRNDLLARLGGEEFAILLPDTAATGAHEFAERLRQQIAARPAATDAGDIPVTVSIGVTSFTAGDSNADPILARADRAHRAKANGRDRVEQEPLA